MSETLRPDHADGKYQLLPPLSPEDYAALKDDIRQRGVQNPIEFDEEGNVLDGHHRLKICRELEITDYPTLIRRGWTEAEKRTHARQTNLCRRQLSRDERRMLIEDDLRENPDKSDRSIAKGLGVDHKTVGAARERLQTSGMIPVTVRVVGSNGQSQARRENVLKDALGQPVPDTLTKPFRAVPEFRSLANDLLDAKRRLLDLCDLSPALDNHKPRLRASCDRLIEAIRGSVPHAIHVTCAGAGCSDCESLGYVFECGGETPHTTSEGDE